MRQEEVFSEIEQRILLLKQEKDKPIRIAINGIEGTGKTIFALALCEFLRNNSMEAIHVSIDGFHFNKVHRYRQGRDSARGYYEDAYNELAFVEKVLLASQKEKPWYIIATHDLESDAYLNWPPIKISKDVVLVSDGAYLFKPIFLGHWDLKIYLKTDFETARKRGANRDAVDLGGIKAAKEKFINRYHPASKIYIEAFQPETKADLLIDVTDFDNLRLL